MQTGIGAEVVITDKDGKIIARLRHFSRSGTRVAEAAEEGARNLRKFLANH